MIKLTIITINQLEFIFNSKNLSLKIHRKIQYVSANEAIATATKKGVIKGQRKGTTYIYAYAQNGTFAKIIVTVK